MSFNVQTPYNTINTFINLKCDVFPFWVYHVLSVCARKPQFYKMLSSQHESWPSTLLWQINFQLSISLVLNDLSKVVPHIVGEGWNVFF